jgi:hypothetical protein
MENSNAKFAFFYLISLFSLIFMALSSGMIIFQIINKSIVDAIDVYSGRYSPETLKFAISAIVISAPIFFLSMRQIHKNLFSGALASDSAIRKWLSYLILFISSVVMIVWLIMTINGFLNGDLTLKFFLKSVTAVAIAGTIFSFYFYDINRKEVKEKKDKVISVYFYASLIFVIAVFIASLFFVESPSETRNRKTDDAVLNDFYSIDSAINNYFRDKGEVPESLSDLKNEFSYISENNITHPSTREQYGYNRIDEQKYELCAEFYTSNLDNDSDYRGIGPEMWPHSAGEQCIEKRIEKGLESGPPVLR